jgi:hypothetical protein
MCFAFLISRKGVIIIACLLVLWQIKGRIKHSQHISEGNKRRRKGQGKDKAIQLSLPLDRLVPRDLHQIVESPDRLRDQIFSAKEFAWPAA